MIALPPQDSAAEGQIWFPKAGTCTNGNWGSIVAGALRVDATGGITVTRDRFKMVIDGNCGPATATFQPDRERLRIVRDNRPDYTFYVNLTP